MYDYLNSNCVSCSSRVHGCIVCVYTVRVQESHPLDCFKNTHQIFHHLSNNICFKSGFTSLLIQYAKTQVCVRTRLTEMSRCCVYLYDRYIDASLPAVTDAQNTLVRQPAVL